MLLALYVTVRAVFLVDNRSAFADSSWTGIAGAFLHGLRFDLSAIAYSNLPFVLLSLAPAALLARRWYQRALFAVFVLVNATLTVIMMGDVGYFPFTGTRVTLDVFALSNEAQAQAGQLFVNFAGLTAIGLALIAGLVFLYPRARDGVAPRRSGFRPRAARWAWCCSRSCRARRLAEEAPQADAPLPPASTRWASSR